jgi:hypothetical protein
MPDRNPTTSNPLYQEAYSGFLIVAFEKFFRKSPVLLKIFPKTGRECTVYTGENWPMRAKESRI